MSINCRVSFKNNTLEVVDKNGQPSKLYYDALDLTKSEDKAFDLWYKAFSEEFTDQVKPNRDDVTLDEVLKFVAANSSFRKSLDSEELRSVKDIMEKNSFETLSSFHKKLTEIFRPEGITELNTRAAYESGLYGLTDISEIDLDSIDTLLDKIEGTLLKTDIYVSPSSDQVASFMDTSRKTILGTPEFISQEEIEEEIISKVGNPKDSAEVSSLINSLPYSSFAERFNTNESFKNQVLNNVRAYTKVKTLFIEDGEVTTENLTYYKNLQRTVKQDNDVKSLLADVEFLEEIDDDVWAESQEEVRDVLTEIEQRQYEENGIDVFGLSKYSSNKELVISTLNSLGLMIENPTKGTILNFANKFTELVPQQESSFSEIIPENLEPFSQNVFKVHSNLSESTLFRDHGLIKVGENLYHKVDLGNRSELYDQLYQKAQETGSPINIKSQDKVEGLRELEQYVMLQDSTIDKDVREVHTLNKLIFNHPIIQDTNDYSQLSDITSDPEYLTREFPSDFNDYIVAEKAKDSQVYRDTLSKFRIGDSGIYLTAPVKSIDGIDFQRELEDFIRLSKDQSMKYLLPSRTTELKRDSDLVAINNPMSVPSYSRQYTVDRGLLVTESTPNNNIRFFGKTYMKVAEDTKNSVFKQVPENPNNNFYSINKDFITEEDKQTALQVLNDAKFSFVDPVSTREEFENSLEKAGINPEIKFSTILPSLNNSITQSNESLYNELIKVNKISKDQATTLVDVTNTVYKNISNRLGITLDKLKRSIAVKTVDNVKDFVKDIPNNSLALKGLSSEIIFDLSASTEDTTSVDFQDVNPKYIKNLGLKESDYILSNVLNQEDSFAFLGYSQKLSGLGNKSNITKEIERRLQDILNRAKNTNDFYIQELSTSFLQSQVERGQTELEKDSAQAMLDGNKELIQQNIENLQEQQKSNLLSSLNYIIPSTDYPAEFKYLMVGLVLKGNVAKDIEVKNSNNEVVRVIKGNKSKRTTSTVGNHQELSSMVIPSVFQDMQTKEGSDIHPMELINKYTDESYITREETWDLIKNRISKKTQEGYWIKFEKSNNVEDIQALTLVSKKVAKVMNENPWCTGGGMAKTYLPKGDFYLFLDDELEPQITVRYEGKDIKELKGTDSGQSLSETQTQIAESYLKEIPNGLDYINQIKVSKIYYKLKKGEKLSTEQDLRDFIDTFRIELETYDYKKVIEFKKLKEENLDDVIDLNSTLNVFTKISKKGFSVTSIEPYTFVEGEVILGNVGIYIDKSYRSPVIPKNVKILGDLVLNNTLDTTADNVVIEENVSIGELRFSANTLVTPGIEIKDNCNIGILKGTVILGDEGFRIGNNVNIEKIELKNISTKNFSIGDNFTSNSFVLKDSYFNQDFSIGKNSKVDYLNLAKFVAGDFYIGEGFNSDDIYLNNFKSYKDLSIGVNSNIRKFTTSGDSTISNSLILDKGTNIKRIEIANTEVKSVDLLDVNRVDRVIINFSTLDELYLPKKDGISYLSLEDTYLQKGLLLPDNTSYRSIKLELALIQKSFNIGNNVTVDSFIDLYETKLTENINIGENVNVEFKNIDFANFYYRDKSREEIVSYMKDKTANTLFQDKRGAIVRAGESTLILLDKNNADVTSPIHELVHKYEEVLTSEEVKTIEDWSGYKSGTKDFSEAFAIGFEKYVYEGSELNSKVDSIFKKLKDWFLQVIKDATYYFGGINELTPSIKDIYSKILINNKIEDIQNLESLNNTPLSVKQSIKGEDIMSKINSLKDSVSNSIAFPSVYTPINDTVETVAEELRACN